MFLFDDEIIILVILSSVFWTQPIIIVIWSKFIQNNNKDFALEIGVSYGLYEICVVFITYTH